MSTSGDKIREMADAEAQRAEAESPDDEEAAETEDQPAPEPSTDEPTPEPPPEPSGGLTAVQAGELETATAQYLKRVAKAFGGQPPPACPTCEGLGFDLTGGAQGPEFHEHAQFERCDECDGLGGVKTGSRVPGNDVVPCPRCKGYGYLTEQPQPAERPELVAPTVVALQTGAGGLDLSQLPKPGEPGYEPWMGGGEGNATAPAVGAGGSP
jgi:hypothetical protein